jgi:thiol-disulfide isomerase/thioredoxin
MKNIQISILTALFPLLSLCQSRPFEIVGTITGNYNSKMYIFFDGNFRQRDSISSEIKNGKFYIKGSIPMPVQGRLHMDQQSYIQDFYIDDSITYVTCSSEIKLIHNGQDTMNQLKVTDVRGSNTDKLKSDFESWLMNLKDSKVSADEIREAYFNNLSLFIKKNSKSKLSPYLLGKADLLTYAQVKQLSLMIDTSLKDSYETNSVTNLLNYLDKSKNSAIGKVFQDFALNDSSGNRIETKQFRGKYMLIVFWASWCKPCRVEHPDLNIIYERYKDKDFIMIGISFDKDKLNWTKAVVKDNLRWTQVIDNKAFESEIARYYDIEGIPKNYLLDKCPDPL